MKTLILIVVFSAVVFFTGFFTGYMVTRTEINPPLNPTIKSHSETITSSARSAGTPAAMNLDLRDTRALTYEAIEAESSIFSQLKLAHLLADEADVEGLKALILKAVKSRDPLYNYNLVSIFLEKFTSLDPSAAIKFIEANSSIANHRFISHVVTSWVREDPEAAIDYFNSLTNMQLKNEIAGRLFSDPTLVDSGLLAELEQSLGQSAAAMRGMMQANQLPPPQALEEALLMNQPNRMSAIQIALIRWLHNDPEAAIARIQSHSNTDERHQMLQSILHEYVNIDEDAAFAFARANLSDNVQLEQQMLSMLGQRDPKRTLPMIEDFISRTGNANPLNSLIATWIQQAPAEALAYIDTMDEQRRGTLYQSAAFSYVNSHPDEAFDWLLRQSDRYPQMVENTIASSINHNTISIAERMVAQVENPSIRTRLITGIGNYKASQNPEAALRWLEGYQRDPAYPTAVQNVISSMSHQNPKGAARAIEARITEDYAAPIVGQVAANWYRGNPQEALGWLRGLPDGEAKNMAFSSIVSNVAHQDPEAALEILDGIPEGPRKSDAKRNIAYSRLSRSPNDIEDIIKELDLTGQDAAQLRAMAKQRQKVKSGISGSRP
ncbi:MAG: thioredoxin-like negative regulator of GroEL [Candidatus Azotimanducaceae bacterium]|jgi:thioredoxin-like negative regulator of GroEL